MSAILPGATIGIFGGGQLGRMLALAARTLGYHVVVLDPDGRCAASAVADRVIAASFDDPEAAAELGRSCDVITLEIEKISPRAMMAASEHAPVRPGTAVIAIVQDRARQKGWLEERGFPIGPYRLARNADELGAAMRSLGGECFVKATTGGFDGRGQARVAHTDHPEEVWRDVGAAAVVVERGLELQAELSVLTARRPGGEVRSYPVALNHHERQILDWSVMPAPLPQSVVTEATELGARVTTELEVEGLLAVEMFLLVDGTLLINELAPRPHNSFHHTELACPTSQFEQGVRAVCDLPLGTTEAVRPAAMVNLFGDLWLEEDRPRFDRALAVDGVKLHLYGKQGPRAGRKMGHLTALDDTPEKALARARAAFERLQHQTRSVAGSSPAQEE